MFEEVFVSDNPVLNSFVFIYMYWWIIVGIFVPAFYYIFLKIFTFPLITRKAHEFVLVVSPESVTIKKITSRLIPFFVFRKNIYWFDESCQDVHSLNKFNIYIEGINQNITKKEKHEDKVHDITKEIVIPKQITAHKILLPINIKQHFNRHFVIIIDPKGMLIQISASKMRQPLRVSFYHTLGIYLQQEVKTEEVRPESAGSVTGGSNYQLVQLNTQTVLQQIKYVSQYRYYSSHWAYQLSRRVIKTERNWMTWLKGAIDPKVILAMLILVAVAGSMFIVMYMFGNPQAMLGPMPTG